MAYIQQAMNLPLERRKRRSRSHHHNRPVLLFLIQGDILDNLPDLELQL